MIGDKLVGETGCNMRIVVAALFCCFLAACQTQQSDTGRLPPASVTAWAGDLATTDVTVDLASPIEAGRNLLWCSSFQMAWDELRATVGGPVALSGNPPLAIALNRIPPAQQHVERTFTATAGRSTRDRATLQRQLKEVFGASSDPRLLASDVNAPSDGFFFYGYLRKSMPFETAFDEMEHSGVVRSDDGLSPDRYFHGFGLYQYIPETPLLEMAQQIRVIWYQYADDIHDPDQYILELLTRSPGDRLVLARIDPQATLKQTVDSVVEHLRHPNTKPAVTAEGLDALPKLLNENEDLSARLAESVQLETLETVTIPELDFDVVHRVDDLIGRTIENEGSAVKGLPVDMALQRIRFKLDRTGAELESEGSMSIFGGGRREFAFRGPFLILILRTDSLEPELACWIANNELLNPLPQEQTPAQAGDSIFYDTDDE